jgi:hypothetical protein
MSNLSMKQLYTLAMGWASEQEAQGLSHEEITHRVDMVADYLDYVWKHKAGKGSSDPSDPQEAL